MKRVILSAIFILLMINGKSQGLIFDSTAFSQRDKIEETRAEIPGSVSLKKYTPILYPQIGSTCVAHAFANARTILYAKNLNWTDKNKVTSLSFSPYYIYYRNKGIGDQSCESGLNIETVCRDVLVNGIAPIIDVEYPNYYPFSDKILCNVNNGVYFPPSMEKDLIKAKKYIINDIYRVTSLNELMTALSEGMPVILCMYIPKSFSNLKGDIWIPQVTDKIDKQSGHAILAIGYDETKYGGSVELMNSWGEEWGNKGFTWVRYKDFSRWFMGGYAIYVDNSMYLKGTNNTEFKPEKAKIERKVMKLNSNDGKSKIIFNNTEFISSFINSKGL